MDLFGRIANMLGIGRITGGHDDSGGGDRAYRIVRLCCY